MHPLISLCILLIGLVLFSTPAAAAADLELKIENGRVTLVARNVPLEQLLRTWSAATGTEVVGADALSEIVNLELRDVPEATALKTVLRSVAGYIVVPRREGFRSGSQFGRILILPESDPSGAVLARLPASDPPGRVVAQSGRDPDPDPSVNLARTPAEWMAAMQADATAVLSQPDVVDQLRNLQQLIEAATGAGLPGVTDASLPRTAP
jgi:hypothetical protein